MIDEYIVIWADYNDITQNLDILKYNIHTKTELVEILKHVDRNIDQIINLLIKYNISEFYPSNDIGNTMVILTLNYNPSFEIYQQLSTIVKQVIRNKKLNDIL